ncbi:MAG: hypothetical protein Kow0069_02590 [Promethearchaeota archaeon]
MTETTQVQQEAAFEPRVLGFLCNWCSYAGADLAGVSRIQYPPYLRVVRVMCSGRVDPEFVIEGLLQGLDGVIVMGCHPGDCHYLDGNYEAALKFAMVKKILALVGLDDRVHLEWVSASEGKRFAEVITQFTEKIKKLGPSPLGGASPDVKLRSKLRAVKLAACGQRIRVLVGRQRKITQQGNVYGEKVDPQTFEALLEGAIRQEFNRAQILLALAEKPDSVKALAEKLQLDPAEVLEHVVSLRNRNLVAFERIEGVTPYYVTIGGL